MTFPAAVPEIPAASVDKAAAYYVNTPGFTFDWGDKHGGIAGISRGNCRLFITNRSFRERYGNAERSNNGPNRNLDGPLLQIEHLEVE